MAMETMREAQGAAPPPVPDERIAHLVELRDHMLQEVENLRNKVAGIDMALKLLGEDANA